MALKIEDYAIVGDCKSAALIGRNGSVDWLCWPRFDSAACFAALLGTPDHGRWSIAPADSNARATRRYRDGTLILETDFETADGAVTVTDFMPLREGEHHLVRIIIGRRGQLEMRCELALRFDYGAIVPWVTRLADGALEAIAGPDMVVLRTPIELHGEDFKTVGKFPVSEGQIIPFVLTYGPSHRAAPDPIDPIAALSDTEVFWRNWSSGCTEMGEWTALVRRSFITLKALTYKPTGGIVAAPTTSLPERFSGARNWDYRYCWLRDATLTLLSLMHGGFYEEAQDWRLWLHRAVAGLPAQAQIMYGIAGERRLTEIELPWLPGYEGAVPVRIGNAASNQFQLDVYGEVLDAFYQARLGGLEPASNSELLQALLEHVAEVWREPDEGMWEVRGPRQHFTHSKLMAWLAFDRAIKLAEKFRMPGPLEKWKALRGEIHENICEKAYSVERGAFVQYFGASMLDASTLMIPLVGFLPATDPRVSSTIAAIERDLTVDGFVLRYDTEKEDDGLPSGEGAFLACSFWLADCLLMLGRTSDARQLFKKLTELCNDVGLLAEEYDPAARRLAGNFPQAFSHIALINTAHNLILAGKPDDERPHIPGMRTCAAKGGRPAIQQ